MKTTRRFAGAVLAAIRDGKILGIRAGTDPHRIIGIWAVVVDERVFVRSWDARDGGWYRTLLDQPRGVIAVNDLEIPVRAVRTRSERLKDAILAEVRPRLQAPGAQGDDDGAGAHRPQSSCRRRAMSTSPSAIVTLTSMARQHTTQSSTYDWRRPPDSSTSSVNGSPQYGQSDSIVTRAC